MRKLTDKTIDILASSNVAGFNEISMAQEIREHRARLKVENKEEFVPCHRCGRNDPFFVVLWDEMGVYICQNSDCDDDNLMTKEEALLSWNRHHLFCAKEKEEMSTVKVRIEAELELPEVKTVQGKVEKA